MTDKPNYNDGNWHGWNGGGCPVHPKSEVECLSGVIPGKRNVHIRRAGDLVWDCIVAFRVIKEHREPRECWSYGSHIRGTEAEAVAFRKAVSDSNPGKGYESHPITKWREVLP